MNHQQLSCASFMLVWHLGTRELQNIHYPQECQTVEAFCKLFAELEGCFSEEEMLDVFVRNEHLFECFGPIGEELRMKSALQSGDIAKALDSLSRGIQMTRPRHVEPLIEAAHKQVLRRMWAFELGSLIRKFYLAHRDPELVCCF